MKLSDGRDSIRRPSPASATVVVLTLVALGLRWPTLAGPSFWVDEWVTRQIVSRPFLEMLRAVKASESTPPLYYAVAWVWTHLFGTGEFALRSLSGLVGAAVVPVVYATGSVLASRRTGVIAAALVAVNPLLVWYSTEARAYSLLVLLASLTFLFFARALVEPTGTTLALWSLTSSLALTTHYFAVYLAAAETLVLLVLSTSARRRVCLAVVPVAATALALVPLVSVQGDHAPWIADLPLGARLADVPRTLAVGVSEPRVWLAVTVGGLTAAALALLARAGRRERRAAVAALAVGVLALALPVLALVWRDDLIARNVIATLVPLAVAVAVACGARRSGAWGVLVAAGLCAASIATLVAIASNERLQRADWSEAARMIGQPSRTRLVVAWPGWGTSPLGDELPGARRLGRGQTVRVAEVVLLGTTRPRGRSCWSGAACNMSDVHPRRQSPLSSFSFAGARKAGLFEVLRFRAARAERLGLEDVRNVDPRYGIPAVWLQSRASAAPGWGASAVRITASSSR